MDELFEVLRSSTDNAARKEALQKLRAFQQREPEAFLSHTFNGIASLQLKEELRFFLCTLVLSFLEESWHNAVDKGTQQRFLEMYVGLLLQEAPRSMLLARKVSTIVAVMARRGSRKAQLGSLPPALTYVSSSYIAALEMAVEAQAHGQITQVLLFLHVFLKEVQHSCIGHTFEDICRTCVKPLSAVFALLPCEASMLEHYDLSLYLLKCSLRTFGCGVFDHGFCHFLRKTTWGLAAGIGQDIPGALEAERRQRLVEYALKLFERETTSFPARLHELGLTFFVTTEKSSSTSSASAATAPAVPAPDYSLCNLLSTVVGSRVGDVVSEKSVCRALRVFTMLLAAEDGDEFIAECLRCFTSSAYFSPLLRHMVSAYFADDTSSEALREWGRYPEQAAAELDVDMDDETSMTSCAEQLFLAFTGSTGCATTSLGVAWAVVNELLQEGNETTVTAALHAIGIGYYTMVSDDSGAYLEFLHARLLPLLDGATLTQASPFVVRRVVWLLGMWCASVPESTDRYAVLAALEAVLHHASATRNTVLALVALKATENFVSDNLFRVSDMPSTMVPTVLQYVQDLLSGVQSPVTVKGLAGLVHVLIAKGALQSHGGILVRLFLPPVQSLIDSLESRAAQAREHWATSLESHDGDDEGEDAADSVSSLTMLLECLGSSLRCCDTDDAVWHLFHPVVQRCTSPNAAATAWVGDNAWELFLIMSQHSRGFTMPVAAEALSVALQHTTRDFDMLPLVYRVVYTLLLLRHETVENVITPALLEGWLRALRESPSSELCGSIAALLFAVTRMSAGPLRALLLQHAVQGLLLSSDVQGAQHTLTLAVVLSVGFASVLGEEELVRLVAGIYVAIQSAGPSGTVSQLLEQLVLLLDVSPSALVSRAVARVLETLCHSYTAALSEDDQGMVERAIEGVTMIPMAAHGNGGSASGSRLPATDEGEVEVRSSQEMLMELMGDEDVPESSPHVARLVRTFGTCLF